MMLETKQIGGWLEELASKAPVPGGGGASALCGALAAALGQMVANLTVGKKRYADVETEMQQYLRELDQLRLEMIHLADRDAEVFEPLAAAYALPKNTETERLEKAKIMEKRLFEASLVPLQIMEQSKKILDIIDQLEKKGSRMAVSDAGAAAQLARAAINGGAMNVYINTKSMENRSKAAELNAQAAELMKNGTSQADALYQRVLDKLAG